MEVEAVQQFYNYFQEFLYLSTLENWPESNTTDIQIKNALDMARHVEKYLDRMQKRNIMYEFLSALNKDEDYSSFVFKSCISDPPKWILRKILISKCNSVQLEVGLKYFVEYFDEKRLEDCMTDVIVERASIQTLVHNINSELTEVKILNLKSSLFLAELCSLDNINEIIIDLCSSNKNVSLLIYSLLNKTSKYSDVRSKIKNKLLYIMKDKSATYKLLWQNILMFDKNKLIELCLEHNDIFTLIVKALIDCRKLMEENISSSLFHIDLTYQQLQVVSKNLFSNQLLKNEFFSYVRFREMDLGFWENLISS